MPVNYLQIKEQLPSFCQKMKTQLMQMDARMISAKEGLTLAAQTQQLAAERIKQASVSDPFLRCAMPGSERMDRSYPLPLAGFQGMILAADGSQILPSRQRQVDFSVINVGLIAMSTGSGEAPVIERQSQLVNYDQEELHGSVLSEGYIALLRDLAERKVLLTAAQKYSQPVVTLTDGGLELYLEQRPSGQYDRALQEHRDTLSGLQQISAITAGFVDKPGSSFVMRMLDILAGRENRNPSEMGIDRLLFAQILTDPGSRSAIFQIVSPQNRQSDPAQSVHFFYMNTSSGSNPSLARIEIPSWVAANQNFTDTLHRVLFNQCQSMHPAFPYLLHRAHEEAVISMDEAGRVEEMLIQELYQQQVPVGMVSGKQAGKDLSGRKRY